MCRPLLHKVMMPFSGTMHEVRTLDSKRACKQTLRNNLYCCARSNQSARHKTPPAFHPRHCSSESGDITPIARQHMIHQHLPAGPRWAPRLIPGFSSIGLARNNLKVASAMRNTKEIPEIRGYVPLRFIQYHEAAAAARNCSLDSSHDKRDK